MILAWQYLAGLALLDGLVDKARQGRRSREAVMLREVGSRGNLQGRLETSTSAGGGTGACMWWCMA